MQTSTPFPLPTATHFNDLFRVIVGPEPSPTTFTLHKGVAGLASPYLAAAMRRNTFKEGREETLVLADEDPLLFGEFVAWIYTRRFPMQAACAEPNPSTFTFLVRFWVFADKYMAPALCNQIIDAIHAVSAQSGLVPATELAFVYAHTRPESGLRRLVVDLVVFGLEKKIAETGKRLKWPREANDDVIEVALWYCEQGVEGLRGKWKDFAATMRLCEFHEHADAVQCA